MTEFPTLVHAKSGFATEAFTDIVPSSAPWLVKGALPMDGVAFLVGHSQAGKSFLALDIALRIASGAKALERKAKRTGVVYIAAEDAGGCRARIEAWKRYNNRAGWRPFHLLDAEINLLDQRCVDTLLQTFQESHDAFEDQGDHLGLIVFDTLSRCLPGVDENNSQDMSRAFVVLKRITSVTGALVLVLAHFGKAGEERGIRGWSGMDANSDATITLEKDSEDETLRVIKLHKVKNGIAGLRLGFRLQKVGLGLYDEDHEEIDSCVCVYDTISPDGARQTKRKAMSVPEKIVFDAIRYLTDNGHTQPIPQHIPGIRPHHKGLRRGDIAMQCLTTGLRFEGEKDAAYRQRFGRALQGLAAQRRIRIADDLVWLI